MIIPDKNVFIVTSALKPAMGAYTDEQRFSQTIASLKSIRHKVPDAVIIFTDISVRPVSDLEKESIASLVNYYMDMSEQPVTRRCAIDGLKSLGENVLLFDTLVTLKQNLQLSKLLSQTKRIFKFSARTVLEDDFDITEYNNLFGKFVFKKRIPTWLDEGPLTHLLITRMYSFCPSLIDTYLGVIQKNANSLNNGVPDTEHAHFMNIPQEHLVEFDKIYCWGWLSGNGQIEHY